MSLKYEPASEPLHISKARPPRVARRTRRSQRGSGRGSTPLSSGSTLRSWTQVSALTPSTLHPAPFTLHPTPFILHPTPYTLQSPYTQHPTVAEPEWGALLYSTLYTHAMLRERAEYGVPTPYTLHPTP